MARAPCNVRFLQPAKLSRNHTFELGRVRQRQRRRLRPGHLLAERRALGTRHGPSERAIQWRGRRVPSWVAAPGSPGSWPPLGAVRHADRPPGVLPVTRRNAERFAAQRRGCAPVDVRPSTGRAYGRVGRSAGRDPRRRRTVFVQLLPARAHDTPPRYTGDRGLHHAPAARQRRAILARRVRATLRGGGGGSARRPPRRLLRALSAATTCRAERERRAIRSRRSAIGDVRALKALCSRFKFTVTARSLLRSTMADVGFGDEMGEDRRGASSQKVRRQGRHSLEFKMQVVQYALSLPEGNRIKPTCRQFQNIATSQVARGCPNRRRSWRRGSALCRRRAPRSCLLSRQPSTSAAPATPPGATNPTGYKGVYAKRGTGRFEAKVCSHGQLHHIGNFDTALEAAEAYARHVQSLGSA